MNAKLLARENCLATALCIAMVALAPFAARANGEPLAAEPAIATSPDGSDLQWGGCPDFLPAGCAIAVLHGDPAKPNVDIFLRVPAKSEIAPHTHTSAERMILVAGEMRVAYAGQAIVTLRPGTYAYGPAGRPHSASCVSDAPCILFIAFESPLDAMPIAAEGR